MDTFKIDESDVFKLLSEDYHFFLYKLYDIADFDTGVLFIKNNSNINIITLTRIIDMLFTLYSSKDYFPSQDFVDIMHIHVNNIIREMNNGKSNLDIKQTNCTIDEITSFISYMKQKQVEDPEYVLTKKFYLYTEIINFLKNLEKNKNNDIK
jgi:hypothetical protein